MLPAQKECKIFTANIALNSHIQQSCAVLLKTKIPRVLMALLRNRVGGWTLIVSPATAKTSLFPHNYRKRCTYSTSQQKFGMIERPALAPGQTHLSQHTVRTNMARPPSKRYHAMMWCGHEPNQRHTSKYHMIYIYIEVHPSFDALTPTQRFQKTQTPIQTTPKNKATTSPRRTTTRFHEHKKSTLLRILKK